MFRHIGTAGKQAGGGGGENCSFCDTGRICRPAAAPGRLTAPPCPVMPVLSAAPAAAHQHTIVRTLLVFCLLAGGFAAAQTAAQPVSLTSLQPEANSPLLPQRAANLNYIRTYRDDIAGPPASEAGLNALFGASDLALSPDGSLLFVAGDLEDAVTIAGVDRDTGSLTQRNVYRDDSLGGLSGPLRLALSPGGRLLFVAAFGDDALSVWEVDARAGSLQRTNTFNDGRNNIDGLGGASGLVSSPDKRLLFVTAKTDNALSVWRVDTGAGTLMQSALYLDDDGAAGLPAGTDAEFDGLGGAADTVVSPDGRLLFVAAQSDNALSVWLVNAEAGTLEQTDLHKHESGSIEGLRGASDLAISPDGRLLFAASETGDALSVWQVDARALTPTITHSALYLDDDGIAGLPEGANAEFDGLDGASDITLSLDGSLLFVTARVDDTLSVWEVNTEAGTLTQSMLHKDGRSGIDGLNGAFGIALSPDDSLLFVTGHYPMSSEDHTLSVWRTNSISRVLSTAPIMLTAQVGSAVSTTTTLVISAMQDEQTIEKETMLFPGETSATAVFEADTLGLGRWTFQVTAVRPPDALTGLEAVQTEALVVPPQRVSLELTVPELPLERGAAFTITVAAEPVPVPATALEVQVSLTGDGVGTVVQTAVQTVTLTLGTSFSLLTFTVPGNAPRTLMLATQTTADGLALVTDVTGTVTVIVPPPRLSSLQPEVARGLSAQLVQAGLYRDDVSGIDGLRTARGMAVSADGSLLFVAAQNDHALSVWQVNAEAGTLTQSALYRDDSRGGEFDGLDGATIVALSPDGSLLFVTANGDDALSVWQVNAEAGTLTQSALYKDGSGGIDGLDGAARIAISPDGRLLFVAAQFDNALSVWRVDADAGTLTQSALYSSGGDLNGASGIALSPDNSLLFVVSRFSDTLSVWQVNATVGTLDQLNEYRDGSGGIDGLEGAFSIAISPDGSLLFVTAEDDNALSVWQVNPFSASILTQSALYKNPKQFGISDLIGFESLVLSPDGSLLFATAHNEDALRVWEVNAAAGTLMQSRLYLDDDGIEGLPEGADAEFDGLDGALGLALSPDGRLLFVTAANDNTLSVWHIIRRVVPMEEIMLRVRISEARPEGTTLIITARQDEQIIEREAALLAEQTSATAVFEAGALGPGRWTFQVTGTIPPDVLMVRESVRTNVLVVQPPLLALELTVPERSLMRSTQFRITVAAVSTPMTELEVQVSLTGEGVTEVVQTVTLTTSTLSRELTFTVPENALQTLQLATQTTAQDVFLAEVTEAIATATVIQPVRLALSVSPMRVPKGGPFRVTLTAEPALPAGAELRVVLSLIVAGVTTATQTATLTREAPSRELPFTAPADAPNTVTLATRTMADESLVLVTETTATVTAVQPVRLALSISPMRVPLGDSFRVTLTAEPAPPAEADLNVVLSLTGAGMTIATQTATLTSETPSQELTFTVPADAPNTLTLATGTTADESLVLVTEAMTATVTAVQPVRLALSVSPMRVPLGDSFRVTLTAEPAPPAEADLSVVLSLTGAGMTIATQTAILTMEAPSRELPFTVPESASSTLVLATGTTADESLVLVTEATAMVTTVQPVRLALSISPMRVPLGDSFRVTLTAEPAPPAEADLDVVLTLTGAGVPTATQAAILTMDAPSRELPFTAPADEPHTLTLTTKTMADESLVLVTEATATVTAVQPVRLALSVSPMRVPLGDSFRVTLTAEPAPPAEADLSVVLSLTGAGMTIATQTATLTMEAPSRELTLTVPESASSTLVLATGTTADESLVLVTEATATVTTVQPVRLALSISPMPVLLGDSFRVTLTAEPAPPSQAELVVTLTLAVGGVTTATQIATLTATTPTQSLAFTAPAPPDATSPLTLATNTMADESLVLVTETTASVSVTDILSVRLRLTVSPMLVLINRPFRVTLTAEPAPPSQAELVVTLNLAVAGVTTATQTATLTATTPSQILTFTAPADAASALTLATNTMADESRVLVTEATATVTLFQPVSLLSLQAESNEPLQPQATADLSFIRAYRDCEIGLCGLDAARHIAVSADGSQLFVTGDVDNAAVTFVEVDKNAGTLRRLNLYRALSIDGLAGASALALSPDNSLLYITAATDNALSVWRVDAGAGTLERTDLHEDGEENIDGLDTPSDLAVSPDGRLVFVVSEGDNALSVWQVDAEALAPAITQSALYRDGSGGIDGLDGASGIAISPDGSLLFVAAQADDALSVWRVNTADGTVEQTDLHKHAAGNTEGLDGVSDLALSPDGRLLFAASETGDALSVWQVNARASAPTIMHSALYLDDDGAAGLPEGADAEFDGLDGVSDLALSSDGGLLFVTARTDDTLSVWEVDAAAGTLMQSTLHRDGSEGADGLDGAFDVELSPDDSLLFVTGNDDSTLSLWRVAALPAVLLSEPVMIRAQVDSAAPVTVTLVIAAMQGEQMITREATLLAGQMSAAAVFAAGTLGPGRWTFEVTAARPPDVLPNTGSARTEVLVVQQPLRLSSLQAESNAPLGANLNLIRTYRDCDASLCGLAAGPAAARNIALSTDGSLLFVTGDADDAVTSVRVDKDTGILQRLNLYRDRNTDGLDGASALVLSPDDSLLFITARNDDALSVWRVNAADGTLEQTDLHRDGEESIDGLDGPSGLAISPDGRLLFVVSKKDDALSVWQVDANALTPTITQSALYLDDDETPGLPTGADGEADGLDGASGIALSPDGSLLFVAAEADDALSVWRVNAADGTVEQTDLHKHAAGNTEGLDGASALALSPDGRLLFAVSQTRDALSVWQVDASALTPTITHSALYLDDDGTAGLPEGADAEFDGLDSVSDITPRSDGGLLFVTARADDTLSVWEVNAEAGTLTQSALYQDGINGIDGLDGAFTVVLSPDDSLLFVTGNGDDTLSVWRIGATRVLSIEPITIRAQVGNATPITATLVIAARLGEQTITEEATLLAGKTSAAAVFGAGALAVGRWTFEVMANRPPGVFNTESVRAEALVVHPPVTLELTVPDMPLMQNTTIPITVTATPAPATALNVQVSLTGDGVTTAMQTATLTSGTPSQELTFTVPENPPRTLRLATQTPTDEFLEVTEATASVAVLISVRLRLIVSSMRVPINRPFRVTLTAEPAPPSQTDMVVALTLTGAEVTTAMQTATLTATTPSQRLSFTALIALANAPSALTLATNTTADESRVLVTEATAMLMAAALQSLDFVEPEGVNTDDLVFALRHFMLCADADGCSADEAQILMVNLPPLRLGVDITAIDTQSILTAVAGDSADAQGIVILLQYLSQVPIDLLLPLSEGDDQAEAARQETLDTIRNILEIE